MFRKRFVMAAFAVVASACAAGLLAGPSSGSGKAQPRIGLVRGTDNGFYDDVQEGAEAASSALGDQLVVDQSNDPAGASESLIAQDVNAIAVDPGDIPIDSSLQEAKAAGIATLSYRDPSNGTGSDSNPHNGKDSVWITQSSPTQFAHALADALAAQMGGKGRYAIVPCQPADAIVQTWFRAIKAYIPTRYPHMTRIKAVYGNDTGNAKETRMFVRFIKKHRHLRGLIALCPTEAFVVPRAIMQAHKVGMVFASGNGGDYAYAPVDPELVADVRSGAEQLVSAGNPVKLGYLTVWAADYLASGHTFSPGRYAVGGPVGTVSYGAANQELRLGQTLTITEGNIDQFAGG
jgi:rhamnose transport system substrate-binding protein